MAQDLSFFDYKRAVVADYERPGRNRPMSAHLLGDKTSFYQLSFHNRGSVELEYKLLNMLVQVEELPVHYKNQANHYLESAALFLLRDAKIADNTAEAEGYEAKLAEFQKLRTVQNQPSAAAVATESEWRQSVDTFYKDVYAFASAPTRISTFVRLLSYLNLYRLLTVFSRLSFKFFWNLAAERQWIDAQDKFFGISLQRAALDLPTNFLNFLSVSLFALRLGTHAAAIIKHALSQRKGEKEISVWDRVLKEFSARMMHIMNDIAWVFINLLTNYAAYWQIADPIANAMLALTLVWDCVWLCIHFYREERDWSKKKLELETWRDRTPNSYDRAITVFQLRMLADLQIETRAKYAFMILAGLSITTSYLIFLAGISAMVSAICLVVCVLGFAMYGSADEFAGMMRAYFGELKIKDELSKNTAKFFNTFTQTLLPPFIVMGLLSLGWQVAFLGAIAAVAYAYLPRNLGLGGTAPQQVDAALPLADAEVIHEALRG